MDLGQVAQRVTDLDRAEAFYSDLLGSAPTGRFEPPGLLFFQIGETRLLLDKGAPSSLIYLKVEDLEATLDRLRARGVAVVSEPHVIFRHQDDSLGPSGLDEWHAFIRDPDENLVGLIEQR